MILPAVPNGYATSDNFGEGSAELVILGVGLMMQGLLRNSAVGYYLHPLCSPKSARVIFKVMP